MQRSGVPGMATHHFLGDCDNFGRPFHWISVAHPVTPGVQVHHRLDIEHGNVGISGEAAVHLPHRVSVGLIIRLAAFRVAAITLFKGGNKRALARGGFLPERGCLAHQLEAGISSFGSIGALIFGPSTSAWPQYAIASEGSSLAASRNARPASA